MEVVLEHRVTEVGKTNQPTNIYIVLPFSLLSIQVSPSFTSFGRQVRRKTSIMVMRVEWEKYSRTQKVLSTDKMDQRAPKGAPLC